MGIRSRGAARLPAVLIALAVTFGSHGEELIELLDEADALRGDAGALEQELDHLEASLEQQRAELAERTERLERAEADLEAVTEQLAVVEEELEAAEERHEAAREAHREAQKQLAETRAELAASERAFAEQVREAYTGRSVRELELVQIALSEETLGEILHTWARMEQAGVNQHVHVNELLALRREHRTAEARAEQARHEREKERAAAQRARDSVAELRDEQQQRRDEVAERRREQAALVAALTEEREEAAQLLSEVEAELAEVRAQADHAIRHISGGGIVCPVPGARFTNDWHYPRPGGRKHKGTDLFAERGTPVIATADGTVRRRDGTDRWQPGGQRDLGGKSVAITTEPGTWWYFAHLDTIADGIRPGARVQAGQQIGTVGNTGNARHTPPHVHLGYYPGGTAQNPYPKVRAACR